MILDICILRSLNALANTATEEYITGAKLSGKLIVYLHPIAYEYCNKKGTVLMPSETNHHSQRSTFFYSRLAREKVLRENYWCSLATKS